MSKKNKHGRIKLIANPGARRLREANGLLAQVTRTLMDLGLRVDVALAKPKRHATPIARRAAKAGYDAVIAMGGDGTVGAVIEGLVGSGVPLGILPVGTMNDFAASLGIPEKLEDACALIASGPTRRVDLGQLSTKEVKKFPFFMVTTIGLISTVYPPVKNVPEGRISGIVDALSLFVEYESAPKVYLTLDKESRIEVETMLVTVVNTPLMGLRNLVAPDASLEDGLLDIAVYPGFSKAGLLAYFARTADQHPAPDGKIERYRARDIRIKTSPKLDIAGEGMIMGRGSARIKALPAALTVIAPEPGTGAEKPLMEEEIQVPVPIAIPVGTSSSGPSTSYPDGEAGGD
ncbi:MAG: diacylglycerol/lipid kinase family protein [Bacteroidota bacterium]